MNRFNSYFKRMNSIAIEAFAEYRTAESNLRKAEEQKSEYRRSGMADAVKNSRIEAELLAANEDRKAARRTLENRLTDIQKLRKELAEALADYYSVSPAALDMNTLELLKSGILKPNEYAKLMREAQTDNNSTMVRIIAKYAKEAAEVEIKERGEDSVAARELRYISHAANQYNGNNYLEAFDNLADIYNRALNNPYFIEHWEEFTSPLIDEM